MTTMGCAVLSRRSGDDNNDSKPLGGGSSEPGPRRDGSAYVGLWCSRVSTTMVAAARTDLGAVGLHPYWALVVIASAIHVQYELDTLKNSLFPAKWFSIKVNAM
uniref:Uncharacterized protein n=1 Tax=Oryza barthii TaxID=65489 RepID=A0A0D3HKK0_9ORYZ